MRRSTGISAVFRLLRSGSAGATALAAILSCSDSTSPNVPVNGIPVLVSSVDIFVPDSLKQAVADQFAATLLSAPGAISANVFISPAAAFSSSSCGSGAGNAVYTVSNVPFDPEPIPSLAPYPLTADGYIPDSDVPLGFNFSFYGNTYDKVNVWSNGFLMFGPPPVRSGFYRGDLIPYAANPNNIIAFAWTDWEPQLVTGGIRFERRGIAPHRRFILQFNNVPEYKGRGLLMSQLVLSEGSNDITIYTNTMSLTNSSNIVTQGIENLDGTSAAFGDSVRNPVNGIMSPRVRAVYKLTNDAIRFSLVKARDTEIPSITAPADITANNDPGLGSAVVAVGSPVASDNCTDVTVTMVRSDGKAIDAPYPVGITTITWTAKDAAGNTASATQTITVIDVEAPSLSVPLDTVVNATSPNGAVFTFAVNATDNVGVTSVSCDPNSGSVFPIGYASITCVASDAAGNSTSKTFGLEVIGAEEQTGNLIQYILSLGLPNGITNPLVNQLRAAFRDESRPEACKKMDDFMSLVSKKGGDVQRASSLYINNEARRICSVMGCSP